jgi:hypothetical protein
VSSSCILRGLYQKEAKANQNQKQDGAMERGCHFERVRILISILCIRFLSCYVSSFFYYYKIRFWVIEDC